MRLEVHRIGRLDALQGTSLDLNLQLPESGRILSIKLQIIESRKAVHQSFSAG
jgi:hypothetical protein